MINTYEIDLTLLSDQNAFVMSSLALKIVSDYKFSKVILVTRNIDTLFSLVVYCFYCIMFCKICNLLLARGREIHITCFRNLKAGINSVIVVLPCLLLQTKYFTFWKSDSARRGFFLHWRFFGISH